MNTVKLEWKDSMKFQGYGPHHSLLLDAPPPLGERQGPNPNELVVLGLAGSTGMDVVALLHKFKQDIESFEVEASYDLNFDDCPVLFSEIKLVYRIAGPIDEKVALKAVELSQTKYCGVSAMLSEKVPIHWILLINENEVGKGKANFTKHLREWNQTTYEG